MLYIHDTKSTYLVQNFKKKFEDEFLKKLISNIDFRLVHISALQWLQLILMEMSKFKPVF